MITQPRNVYVLTITTPDGLTAVHSLCFSSELAARCDAEVIAEGRLDWLSRTYGMDEQKTEYQVQSLVMWRYSAGHAA